MCGIAGFLTSSDLPRRDWVEAMCARIQHRGPDGEGFFLDDQVALGHRRLSIIDLSGGTQPLGNEDGTLQVIFNGEIYNFQEIRQDLETKGHVFSTKSDTEVLVHLYEEVGERMPEYLNGMFAFAIWDTRHKELFLARDRMGKKPLYYSFDVPGLRFSFASELKALTVLPRFSREADPHSVIGFLSMSYVGDPETIYKGVRKLPGGHWLKVSREGSKTGRYWRPSFDVNGDRNLEDTLEELRAIAADAVEKRMISDVPLGAFLSGGVDSSAAVAQMSQVAPDQVKTFSIGFTSEAFNELEFARLVVERYRTEHHEQTLTPSIHEMLGTLVEEYDEPFGDSSAVPSLYLARMTRQYVTVALSGDGADEIFGGYRRYFYGVLEARLRSLMPGWFRRSAVRLAGKWYPKFDYLPQWLRAKTLLGNVAQELGDSYYTSMSVFRDESLEAILSPELRRSFRDFTPRERYRRRFAEYQKLPPLSQMQAVDFDTYLPGDILVKADRATMAYSLESRSPWLDYRIVELAGKLPPALKLNGKIGKYVFKRAVEEMVPRELIIRRKKGFSVPLAEWFRMSLGPTYESLVLRPEMEEYIDIAEARRLNEQHQSGLHNHDRKLWNLLMLACWFQHHCLGRSISESPHGA